MNTAIEMNVFKCIILAFYLSYFIIIFMNVILYIIMLVLFKQWTIDDYIIKTNYLILQFKCFIISVETCCFCG